MAGRCGRMPRRSGTGRAGARWRLFDLGVISEQRYGSPYIFIHRGDLHRLLADAVRAYKPDAIRLGARCIGLEQSADAVLLRLEDGQSVRGRLLIGADGVHSAVRAEVFGAGRPEFTGCMAWRGVIPRERLPRVACRSPAPIGSVLVATSSTTRCGAGNCSISSAWSSVTIGRSSSWTAQGTRGECLADFADWHCDVRPLIEAIDVPFKWALMARRPMTRWSVGPRHAARRCLPRDAADARPGCRHGDRGRHYSGALPGEIPRGL